jgi:hypothetical protein
MVLRTRAVALIFLAWFASVNANIKKLRKPTLKPSPAPTVTPEPTATYRPSPVPSISGMPTKEQTPYVHRTQLYIAFQGVPGPPSACPHFLASSFSAHPASSPSKRFPTNTLAFTLPVGAERILVSIILPIALGVLGMIVAAYLFTRDGYRAKKHVRE